MFTSCPLQSQCTTSHAKRIKRWEKEDILDAADALLKQNPDAMRQRKRLVEHPYGTIKHWMGSTHFLMKRLPNVQAEMSLHVLAYNLTSEQSMYLEWRRSWNSCSRPEKAHLLATGTLQSTLKRRTILLETGLRISMPLRRTQAVTQKIQCFFEKTPC